MSTQDYSVKYGGQVRQAPPNHHEEQFTGQEKPRNIRLAGFPDNGSNQEITEQLGG